MMQNSKSHEMKYYLKKKKIQNWLHEMKYYLKGSETYNTSVHTEKGQNSVGKRVAAIVRISNSFTFLQENYIPSSLQTVK